MPKIETPQEMLNKQRKTIKLLQEKIELLKFDVTELNRDNKELRKKLESRTNNIKRVREEVATMKKTGDFSGINHVLLMLHSGWEDEY